MKEVKKLNDRNLIKQIKKYSPKIVTFNGSGFDLYFLFQ